MDLKNSNKTSSFFSLHPLEYEAVEKASDNRTATHKDPDSKAAVTKKKKQVCKCSNCVEHRDDNA